MASNRSQKQNDSQSKGKNKSSKKKSKFKSFLKRSFIGLLVLFMICFVVGLGYVFAIIKAAPPLDVNSILNLNQASMLYDSNGKFMDNLPTDEERYVIPFDKMPQNLKDAYVSIEDERFYEHSGIDVVRIAGALVKDIKVMITGEGGLHGASTLTQQLIKNTLLTNETSIDRKVKEIYLSLKLEKKLTKEQILEAYLNTIPLGGLAYGVEAASRLYFGKSAEKLSLMECVYLAAITQAPTTYSAYNPANKDDPDIYLDRCKTVLMKMKDLNYITQEEYDEAYADIDQNKYSFKAVDTDYSLNYEWFSYPAVAQVKQKLMEKYDYTEDEVSKLMVNGGLKIYTTMDKKLQDETQKVLNDRANLTIPGEDRYSEDGVPALQASATIMDYRTGEIKAMVGGRGKQPPHSLNRAYFDLRSIGSTTKPLTVYGPGIDTKKITAATALDDAPLSSALMSKYGYPSQPNNWDFKFNGYTTSRESIRYSKNMTTLQTADIVGLDTALEYGEKLGLVYNNDSKTISALGLGQFNNAPEDRDGGNTFKLAAAFGTFGNSGTYTEALLFTKVVDATGKVILEGKPETHKVYSPQTAYIMYDLLKEPAKFDAYPANFSDIPVAGKTGTTEHTRDFWFSGLTPYYSASVWIGYDMPEELYGGTSSSAAKLWGLVMANAHEGLEYKEISKPSGIVTATVCKDSGKLASNLCSGDQRGSRVINEMFVEGTVPSQYCDVHVSAKVNKNNNKLASSTTPKNLIVDRVFIKKAYSYSGTADSKYVLPTQYDDSKPTTNNNNNNSNNGNNNNNNNGNNNGSQEETTPDNGNNVDTDNNTNNDNNE